MLLVVRNPQGFLTLKGLVVRIPLPRALRALVVGILTTSVVVKNSPLQGAFSPLMKEFLPILTTADIRAQPLYLA